MRPLGRQARAKADNLVVWTRIFFDGSGEFGWLVQRFNRPVALGTNALRQRVLIYPVNRALACRVERRDDDVIGILEAGRKLVEQITHPRVTMRFDNGDDTAFGATPRGGKYRCDFDRVVSVVVVDRDAVPFADELEAAFDAGESSHRRVYLAVFNRGLSGDRYGRKRVQGVVRTGDRHRPIRQLSRATLDGCAQRHIEDGGVVFNADVAEHDGSFTPTRMG